MTTPRDAIAGLSERLRQRGTWSDGGKVWDQDALCAAAATQLDSLLKERDALQARVKELESGIAHAQYRSDNCDAENQSLYNRLEAVESRATRLQQERDKLQAQLPEGMKHCTITFHECEKGHGWLHATNWIDNGCPWCQRDEAYERAAKECSDYARWAEQQISEDDPPESSKSQLFATISNTADDCAQKVRDLVRRLAGPEKEKKE